MEMVSYAGLPNCVRLTDGQVELVITTDVGPRILRAGPVGGANLFAEIPADLEAAAKGIAEGKSGGAAAEDGDKWRPYGGHRLWHSPEQKPRTYAPDNVPVPHEFDGATNTLRLRPVVEQSTGIQKEMDVRFASRMGGDSASRVTVTHRLINRGPWAVSLAPWALTVFAEGAVAVVPHEPFRPFPEVLLPARPLVLWPYTDMADPRFSWLSRHIVLRQDRGRESSQKFGVRNSLGWGAAAVGGWLFVKTSRPPVEGEEYPDFGCNWEVYTNSKILELESLGPLVRLQENGGSVEHVEEWIIASGTLGDPLTDESIGAAVAKLLG